MSQTTNAGIVTAYGAAVRGGYQGSYNDFCTDLANLTQVVNELANLSATAETLVAGSAATATYSNGVFSFGIPRGDKGETGDTGNGIESVSLLSTSGLNKTYRITFTDGTHFDYVVADGKSIVSTVLNVDYTLTITYNDGTTWTSESIRGATGATPNLTIGTVTTGAAGTPASAEINGTAEDPVLNLTIPKGADGDVSPASLASTYSASQTYAVGDYVWYSGQLYCCTTAITTAEAWTAAHWTAAKLADDVKDLKSSIADTTDYALSAYATDTASGAIATFPDGAEDIPIKQLSVGINPVQDLHGYDNPWPGGGGKNLFDKTAVGSGNMYITESGVARSPGSSASTEWRISDYTRVIAGSTYILSGMNSQAGQSTGWCYYSEDKETIYNGGHYSQNPTASFTVPEGASWIRFSVGYPDLGTCQLELGSTATDYVPYENICPITGYTGAEVTRTGKNLFPLPISPETKNGITVESTASGEIWIHGTPTISSGYVFFELSEITSAIIGQQATISINEKIVGIGIDCNIPGGDLTLSMSQTRTNSTGTVSDISGAARVNVSYNVGTIDKKFKVQLELGSTATAFEPYQGTTYPITFPSGTTVYGGNITVNQDGSGSLVVDRPGVTFDGTQSNFAFAAGTTANRITWTGFNTIGVGGKPFISDTFKSDSYSSGFKTIPWLIYNAAADQRMNMSVPTTITSVADFVAYCAQNPVQVVYPLATPITIPLTAEQIGVITSLYGVNNFWADTGDVDVTIRADTALYIAKKIAEALNA